MALPVGSHVPDFTLPTVGGKGAQLVRLSELWSQKPLVILFFPMICTGVCTREMCQVTDDLDKYTTLGAHVVAVSGDNPFAQAAWAKKEKIKVRLLSDYEHAMAKAYDVAYTSFLPDHNLPMGGVPKRSVFIIDATGTARFVQSSDDPTQLPDFKAVESKLKQLAREAKAAAKGGANPARAK